MFRQSLGAALLLLGVISCSGGGDGPTGTTPPVTTTAPTARLLADTARVGSVLMLDIDGATVTGDTVSARIGSTPVRLVRTTATSFAALLPEMPAGASTLQFTVGSTPVSAPVTVLAGLAINDPVGVIRTALDATVAAVPTTAPAGVTTTEWNTRRATLDSMVQAAKAQVASLSPAEQLTLARLFSAAPAVQANVASSSVMLNTATQDGSHLVSAQFFKLSVCQSAMAQVVRTGMPSLLMLGGMVVFIIAPIDPISKAIGTVATAAAFAGTLLITIDNVQKAGVVCGVEEQTDLQDNFLANLQQRGVTGVSASVQAAGPRRFFVGRPITQYPVGTFRRLSTVEIAKDALVKRMADILDGLNTKVAGIASRLPADVQAVLPLLPARIGAPGSARLEAVPPSAVRIDNVQPASVQLSATASGDAIILQTGAAVTDDVPFSYDVISTYDPTIKVTKSGVARPFMSAMAIDVPASVTGTRTITTDANGIQYGTLTCGGSATVRVKGGDFAEWGNFAWAISGPSSITGSDPIRGTGGTVKVFESGDYPFSGSWFYTWSENGQPSFKAFTVTVTISYFDRLTNTSKAVTPFSFNCI
ncbi:MAG: hypothetical protein V4813_15995 [Gemmatimonadota bacterium]